MLSIDLLGRTIGFNLLFRKIRELWRLKYVVDLVATEIDFFLAKFSSNEDYEYAKYGGLWIICNHYLKMRLWQPNFNHNKSSLKNMLVWVCQ